MRLILIETDSKVLLDRKIKEIVGKSTNIITYHYKDCSMSDLLEEASYVSLFEEEKFLILKNATFFGKEKLNEKESDLLLSYLEKPYPNTSIIFTTYEEVDMRKKITKKMTEDYEYISLKAPKNYELTTEVKKLLKDYRVTDSVIKYLIDACLGNYDILVNEIEKFDLIFKKDETLKLEQMKKIVASNVNDNVFKFVDAVVMKDSYTAFQMLNDFESIKFDVLQLENVLVREYRLMILYKILARKKYSSQEMARELKLQSWQVDKLKREESLYHIEDLKDYLVQLSKLDTKIKSGEYEKNLAFKTFLIQVFEY